MLTHLPNTDHSEVKKTEIPRRSTQSFLVTRWVFLRCIAALYLVTFLSLLWQIPGLLGENGISPAQENLELARLSLGAERYLAFPTLFWLNSSDAFLYVLCGAGVAGSCLLFLGVSPIVLVPFLWIVHLSFFTVGEELLEFQWDALLLEVGFLALFLAPRGLYPGFARNDPPSRPVLWLYRLLLFRLVFIAGMVRLHYVLLEGVTAFEVPFVSQPVPTLLGWYANGTPAAFRIGLGAVLLASQLLAPFLLFMPRRIRVGACAALILQQVALMAIGLYLMTGLLTIAVCITLLDDAFWRGLVRGAAQWIRRKGDVPASRTSPLRSFAVGMAAVPILILSAIQLVTPLVSPDGWPERADTVVALFEPFHIINTYETFALAPEQRPEIIIEGSMDGQTWKPYEFRAKTGDLQKAPLWLQPGLSRLDTRMRLAAMTEVSANPWIVALMSRLLEGSPEVLTLLGDNPFPLAPPRHIRAVRYVYTFNNAETAFREGRWWHREAVGLYAPQMSRPVYFEMAECAPASVLIPHPASSS